MQNWVLVLAILFIIIIIIIVILVIILRTPTCSSGEILSNGVCIPDPCNFCTVSQHCDRSTNTCVNNCTPGNIYLNGQCVADPCNFCTSTEHCDRPNNRCVPNCPNPSCRSDQICVQSNGSCIPNLCIPNHCPTCTRCVPETGNCIPIPCPPLNRCENNQCVPNCPNSACNSDELCVESNGSCIPNLCIPNHCPTCTRCVPETGNCIPISCPSGQHCENNKCIQNCSTIECPRTYTCDSTTELCISKCAGITCPSDTYCNYDSGICETSCILNGGVCPAGKTCNRRDGTCIDVCPCTDPFDTCHSNQCTFISKYVYISSESVNVDGMVKWQPFKSRYLIVSQCGNEYLQFAPGTYSILIYFDHGPNSLSNINLSSFTGDNIPCDGYKNAKSVKCTYLFSDQNAGRYAQSLYLTVNPLLAIVQVMFSDINGVNLLSTVNLEIEKLA